MKYIRKTHPFLLRIKAIWYIIKFRNFILIPVIKGVDPNGQKTTTVKPIFRTDHDGDGDKVTLLASIRSCEKSNAKLYGK